MVTLTPSSDVGRLPPTTSSVRQVRPGLVLARFVPLIITQEPASMPGWKLAASSTEAITGAAGGASLVTNTSPSWPAGAFTPPGTGKSAYDHVCPARIPLPWGSAATANAILAGQTWSYADF